MKQSKRQQEIEARKASDPIAQALGRTDIDYTTDELPTAPRGISPSAIRTGEFGPGKYSGCTDFGFTGFLTSQAKYPTSVLDDLLAAGEISREQYERLRQENK